MKRRITHEVLMHTTILVVPLEEPSPVHAFRIAHAPDDLERRADPMLLLARRRVKACGRHHITRGGVILIGKGFSRTRSVGASHLLFRIERRGVAVIKRRHNWFSSS